MGTAASQANTEAIKKPVARLARPEIHGGQFGNEQTETHSFLENNNGQGGLGGWGRKVWWV